MRIISLVPSQTELLSSLGLDKEVVGITKFCVHPEAWFRSKKRIGGTKQLHFEAIVALNPDLIIGNKEENNREDILKLSEKYPVWMSDVQNLDDAEQMIQSIGKITNREEKASEINQDIKTGFQQLPRLKYPLRTLYLIWKNPYMAAGTNTFINDILMRCGFINVVQESRYPELSMPKIKSLNPELILLSSEPFPFKGKHSEEVKRRFPQSSILEVDGEMFSWYGSRLQLAHQYLKDLCAGL